VHDPRARRVPHPGGSVKDRAALFIIKDAEERRPAASRGGVIVEGTAGNTGIGLALVGKCPRLPHRHPSCRVRRARKEGQAGPVRRRSAARPRGPYPTRCITRAIPDSLRRRSPPRSRMGDLGQPFDNLANRRGHYETTGPRSGEETTARSTASLYRSAPAARSGVGIAVKERNPQVQIYLSDCMGSGIYNGMRVTSGSLRAARLPGIGNNHETGNLQGFTPDGQFRSRPGNAAGAVRPRAGRGAVLGGSTGIQCLRAIRLGARARPGTRSSRSSPIPAPLPIELFNPEFLKSRELPTRPAGRKQ